jgi:hypothetical protein
MRSQNHRDPIYGLAGILQGPSQIGRHLAPIIGNARGVYKGGIVTVSSPPPTIKGVFPVEYRPKAGVCASCPLRSACTRDKAGHTIKRYEHQELLDRARRQSHSLRGRLDRKRRQWLQERNFGEAAVDHGFKRARWRGLGRQSIQDSLIAAIQNLRILARRMRLPNKSPLFHAFSILKA